jgi:hypothetical protein
MKMSKSALIKRSKIRGAFLLISVLAIMAVISACLPEPPPPPALAPSQTPTITNTATATIVWFPPTSTYTPFPTRQIEPTQEMRPAIGQVIFSDDFTSTGSWPTQRADAGSVAYNLQELSFAVKAPRGHVFSLLPEPRFDNFYLEVNAQPSICRTADSYGIHLRSAAAREGYRLVINCSGQLRFERETNYTTTPLQDWTPSGQILPGMLLKNRIGIWAVGREIRVFVNDVFQFAVQDRLFTEGQIGFFARAAGDLPITVSFSDLTVSAINLQLVPTPSQTPTITRTPAPTRWPTATKESE